MFWFWLAFGIVLAAVAACFSLLQFQIHFRHEAKNNDFSVSVKGLWGLIRYTYKAPKINFFSIDDGVLVKTEQDWGNGQAPGTDSKKRITLSKVRESFNMSRTLMAHFFQFSKWLTQTLAHVRCTRLYWNTRLGFGDAPDTAIGTGVVWGLKTSLLGYAFKFIRLDTKPTLNVVPQYHENLFTTEIKCLLQIRLGYALAAGLFFLIRIMKVKGGIKTWQRVLFKA